MLPQFQTLEFVGADSLLAQYLSDFLIDFQFRFEFYPPPCLKYFIDEISSFCYDITDSDSFKQSQFFNTFERKYVLNRFPKNSQNKIFSITNEISNLMNKYIINGKYDDSIYWERVNRSLCWLGEGEEMQRAAQTKLSNATVGVAGCGGIGGALVMRLARLGVRHIKIADPDKFDLSNINRQMGSGKTTIGQNKAECVGKMVHEAIDDVTIEIYPDGITVENAEDFVNGCDLVLDQMDFYLINARYALHRAFRNHPKTKCIISAWCIGWGTSVFKYLHDSMPIWEYFDVPENSKITPEVIEKILPKFMPLDPKFPTRKQIVDLLVEKRTVPLFAGTPPLAEAFAIQRTALILADLEIEQYATVLPPAPACYVYDGSTLKGSMIVAK